MSSIQQDILASCPRSVAHMLDERADATPDKLAFLQPDRRPEGPNQWRRITWSEARQEVHEHAAGFLALGLAAEQRVAIAASTRYEWVVADLAVQCAAGAVTAIYPNTTDHDVLYIMQD